MKTRPHILLIVLLFYIPWINTAFSKPIKLGVIVPEGTLWATNLKLMSKEVAKATDGKVKLRIYYGGTAGDEEDVLRKIRIGQMHGGVFTGKTLGHIFSDIRIVEIPFSFATNRKKAWEVLTSLESHFDKELKKRGFINLGFFEVGMIYFVSNKPIKEFSDLKKLKTWFWSDDLLAKAFMEAIGANGVPLQLHEVLGSFSTGMIDTAYTSPLGVLALQWQNKIKFLVDHPVTFSIASFILSKKAWDTISAVDKVKVSKIASKYIQRMNKGVIKENVEAKNILKGLGVIFVTLPKADILNGQKIKAQVLKNLKGKYFSKKAIDLLNKIVTN